MATFDNTRQEKVKGLRLLNFSYKFLSTYERKICPEAQQNFNIFYLFCDAGFRASKLDERTKFSESFYCVAVFYADDIGEGCFFGYFFVCLRRYLFF
jgi:hypothetical protein